MSVASSSNPVRHGAGPSTDGFSADGREVGLDQEPMTPYLYSVERLKEEHHQRRLVLKEQRRAERADRVKKNS